MRHLAVKLLKQILTNIEPLSTCIYIHNKSNEKICNLYECMDGIVIL